MKNHQSFFLASLAALFALSAPVMASLGETSLEAAQRSEASIRKGDEANRADFIMQNAKAENDPEKKANLFKDAIETAPYPLVKDMIRTEANRPLVNLTREEEVIPSIFVGHPAVDMQPTQDETIGLPLIQDPIYQEAIQPESARFAPVPNLDSTPVMAFEEYKNAPEEEQETMLDISPMRAGNFVTSTNDQNRGLPKSKVERDSRTDELLLKVFHEIAKSFKDPEQKSILFEAASHHVTDPATQRKLLLRAIEVLNNQAREARQSDLYFKLASFSEDPKHTKMFEDAGKALANPVYQAMMQSAKKRQDERDQQIAPYEKMINKKALDYTKKSREHWNAKFSDLENKFKSPVIEPVIE
jgi:hypothetical protein